jgi:hypothetical protein
LIIDGAVASATADILIECRLPASAGSYLLTTIRLLLSDNSVGGDAMGSAVDCVGTPGTVFAFDSQWANNVVVLGGVASALVLVRLSEDMSHGAKTELLTVTLDDGETSVTPPSAMAMMFKLSGNPTGTPSFSFAPLVVSSEKKLECETDADPRRLLEGSLARGTGAGAELATWGIVVDCNPADGVSSAVGLDEAIDRVRGLLQ